MASVESGVPLILEIRNLSAYFLDPEDKAGGYVRAVNHIGLTLAKNSFTSLVGESGSGKSVTALMICGLVKPEKCGGEVYYHSHRGRKVDLRQLSEQKLRHVRGRQIAYIFQDPASSLNPVMRVGEQLVETHRVHFGSAKIQARKKAFKLLEDVRLRDAERVFKSFPHELSGGMKQRVMIAMALISDPELLIADEPTTALDVQTEAEIMELLVRLKAKRSLSILFITHNLALASKFSDCIYVMEKGVLHERIGRWKNAFDPKTPYAKKLFNAELKNLKPKTLIEL